jgi:hypothetical protein
MVHPAIDNGPEPCPKCDAAIGQCHESGCDVEQCPWCGGQYISCGLFQGCQRPASLPLDDHLPWTGLYPGSAECQELGWYAKLVKGRGWIPCDKDDPEAWPHLNRLHKEAVWDRSRQRYVLPEPATNR